VDHASPQLLQRAKRLEYFTVGYNSLEALVALVSGFLAGSIALVGFGLDSLIEVTSGGALLWRLYRDERAERTALRVVGGCFVSLAAYVVWESVGTLLTRQAPGRSVAGILLAIVSLVVMPLLARAKRRVGTAMGSLAMNADARQTEFCVYLSAILLGGLVLNALFGWWWADPVAGLVMTPIILREGLEAFRGRLCCSGPDTIR